MCPPSSALHVKFTIKIDIVLVLFYVAWQCLIAAAAAATAAAVNGYYEDDDDDDEANTWQYSL